MQPINWAKAAGGEQPCVLKIALAPPAVPFGVVDHRGRTFLVSALDVMREPDRPSGFADERGFDEIMRKNAAAKRLASRQSRQRTMLHERFHANDGIVTPIIAVALLPIIEAGQ